MIVALEFFLIVVSVDFVWKQVWNTRDHSLMKITKGLFRLSLFINTTVVM